ncbi:MAG: hypothetical protein ACYC96_02770 [Fimbriimonadaceae bacterium]
MLILAGGCAACSLNAIDPRTCRPLATQRYVFFYDVAPAGLPAWAANTPRRISVVADPNRAMSVRMNAFWKPRFVRVSKAGIILAESDNFAGTPAYVHRADGRT